MFRHRLLAFCVALACSMNALTAAAADWASQIGTRLGDSRDLVMRSSATGTVTAVDATARLMALKFAAGSMIFRLHTTVPNVDQIQVGGHVRVGYVAGYLLTTSRGVTGARKPPPAAPLEEREALGAGVYERSLTFVANVVTVDTANLKLRLTVPGGQLEDYPVYDRSALVGVRAGDQVWVSMLQAVALDVTILPP